MGKYAFIKDRDTKKFWSLSWKPTCPKFDFYEVRNGTGYTTITSKINNIKSSQTVFIPPEENIEIWKITISNEDSKTRHLSLYTYFEWCLGSSDDVHREFQKTFINTWFDKDLNTLFGKKKKQKVAQTSACIAG